MAANKVISNKRVTVFAGPATAIGDWDEPEFDDIAELENVSGAVNWDNYDFGVQASPQNDDRTLTDEAGAQSRGETEFGGSIQFVMPKPDDSTSVYRIASDIFRTPGADLVIAVRTVTLNSTGVVDGDEINLYHVESNVPSHGKNDVSHFYEVSLLPRDDVLVGYIVPNATATAATLTPSAAITDAEVGDTGQITAAYEGRNVTVGAIWTSSLPDIVEVGPQGAWRALAVGGPANITARMPGGLVSTAKAITVV